MFHKIGAVILLVSDMKRSIKFYRDTLGMKLKERSKDWTEFSEGGTVLALHPASKKKIKKTNSMLVGFSVSDFDDIINGSPAIRTLMFGLFSTVNWSSLLMYLLLMYSESSLGAELME